MKNSTAHRSIAALLYTNNIHLQRDSFYSGNLYLFIRNGKENFFIVKRQRVPSVILCKESM